MVAEVSSQFCFLDLPDVMPFSCIPSYHSEVSLKAVVCRILWKKKFPLQPVTGEFTNTQESDEVVIVLS